MNNVRNGMTHRQLIGFLLMFHKTNTQLDVVVFSSTAQIYFISDEAKYGLKEYIVEHCANLVGHVSRIKERCFPDWDEICNNLELNPHLPKPK